MTKVTNNHKGLINVAGVDIRPGATVSVPDDVFKKWSNGGPAKQWLKSGVISTDAKVDLKGVPETVDESDALRSKASGLGIDFNEETTDDDLRNAILEVEEANKTNERDALLAEARELGLNPNANTGVDKLKKMIADKKAQA